MSKFFLVSTSQYFDYQCIIDIVVKQGYSVIRSNEVSLSTTVALIEWTGDGTATRQAIQAIRQQYPACRCLLLLPATCDIVMAAL
ncbi:hypothetical protein [Fibrella forsythiae]|uniref:Uncharacterized protein n=1 Tax=Fibrella forsythiae TaxID=2817061 RepID=A0ABS3JN45_9BACT|nr:hypothetical protein [Fibrella forsythiae]MBO0950624.1 hypothetical protein [Fibrella forsythiae]